MNQILLSGNNVIGEFLHTFLTSNGYIVKDVADIAQDISQTSHEYVAILDVNHAGEVDHSRNMLYTVSETREVVDIATKVNIPYLFLFRETEELNADSALLGSLELLEKQKAENGLKFTKIMLGDIYGINLNTCTKLSTFLNNIVEDESLTVENDTKEYYLLNQKDFVTGIIQILSQAKNQAATQTFTLLPEEPVTEIELANFINDLSDLPKEIKFSTADTLEDESVPLDLDVEVNYPENWFPKISLEDGLKELMEYFGIPLLGSEKKELDEEESRMSQEELAEQKTIHNDIDDDAVSIDDVDAVYADVDENADNYAAASQSKPKTHKKLIFVLAFALFGLLTAPSIMFAIKLFGGLSDLNYALVAFNSYDMSSAQKDSEKALNQLAKIQKIPTITKYVLPMFKTNNDQLITLIHTAENTAKSVNLAALDFSKYLAANNSNSKVLGTSTIKSNQLATSLELMEIVKSTTIQSSNTWILSKLKSISIELYKNRDTVSALANIESFLPQIFGHEKEQQYLVLLSDPTKTSGAYNDIIFYSIVSVKDGQAEVKSIDSIQKIIEHLELNNILNSSEIRAGTVFTWEPNFESNARNIYQIFKQEENVDLDGILLVNETFFKSISYDGSTISQDTFKKTIESVFSKSPSPEMVSTVINGLQKKDLIISHKNEKISSALMTNNWTGNYIEEYDDYLYVVHSDESNTRSDGLKIGMNYTGYMPENDTYKRELVINYENTTPSNIFKRVRVYLPKDTILNDAKILEGTSEQKITKNLKASPHETKYVYTTVISIKANSQTALKFEYESNTHGIDDGQLHLVVQKQQGSGEIPLNVTFNYPQGVPNSYKYSSIDGASINNNALQIDTVMNKDYQAFIPL